jgi:hypothetical protein
MLVCKLHSRVCPRNNAYSHKEVATWRGGGVFSGTVVREVHSVPVLREHRYICLALLGSTLGIRKSQWTVRNRAVSRVCLDVCESRCSGFPNCDNVLYYKCFDLSWVVSMNRDETMWLESWFPQLSSYWAAHSRLSRSTALCLAFLYTFSISKSEMKFSQLKLWVLLPSDMWPRMVRYDLMSFRWTFWVHNHSRWPKQLVETARLSETSIQIYPTIRLRALQLLTSSNLCL